MTIAFVKYNPAAKTWAIWSMNDDGSNQQQLADCGASQAFLSWSPNGRKLAYQKAIPPYGNCVWTMDKDGSGQRALPYDTRGGYAGDICPCYTPGGQITLCYVTQPNVQPQPTNICLMDADGGNRQTVLRGNGRDSNLQPRMRSDGRIVWMKSANGRPPYQLWTMNMNGTGARQITDEAANHGDPVWSPDGSRIAFGSDREGGGKCNIFTCAPDGSDIKQVTYFSPPFEAGDTGWSPDGEYICFEWDTPASGQSDPNAWAEVWVVPSDGSGAPWNLGVQCAGVGGNPRWSLA